jgi:hypothetical protein
MNINKIAAKDAAKWAYAELFFGEGAGTRRKLLSAEIAHKVENISNYNEAFNKAYSKQPFANLAIKAAKERKHIDRSNMIGKNAKALLRGDRRGLSTGLLIIVTIGVVAHQTGLDKVALAEGKKYYRKAKTKFGIWKINHNIDKNWV